MKNEASPITRRKLVSWLGVFSFFTAIGAAFIPKKEKKTGTIKMLTKDGKLVEIDASLLAGNSRKVSDKELQNWIKR
jgi:hypothetical protein